MLYHQKGIHCSTTCTRRLEMTVLLLLLCIIVISCKYNIEAFQSVHQQQQQQSTSKRLLLLQLSKSKIFGLIPDDYYYNNNNNYNDINNNDDDKNNNIPVSKRSTRQLKQQQQQQQQREHLIGLNGQNNMEKRSSTTRDDFWKQAMIRIAAVVTVIDAPKPKQQHPEPVFAAETENNVSLEVIQLAFDSVRDELFNTNGNGGIPYMKQLITDEKYDELLEFTKTYDQILRKGKMGKARKYIINVKDKDRATQYCNNVTFDLIGINRSIRPNSSSSSNSNVNRQQNAFKYLAELQDDIEQFLSLQPTEI